MDLTPLEKSTLARLLQKAERAKLSPDDLAQREQLLRAQQDRLAVKEERAAARLSKLQSDLDAITTELSTLLDQQARNVRGMLYRDSEAARRSLRGVVERLHAALPELAARKNFDGDQIQQMLEFFLESGFPTLFKPEPTTNVIPFQKDADDDL